ncbi:cation:proton antiporter [Corynebacterium auriscanis]|uniref:cation:proton antiporter family protein n=1 Tax=Corynebacterium TaxID=1716 RepID=UPI0008A508AE|nr:cation:proton antiporter family protein [Corynebacterium sp. HMSC28B08]OFT87346.1 portal protein [Corynebacterium sp. HMSC28B08]
MNSAYLLTLLFSIIGGLGASLLRLPPLLGFLAAGFAISATGVEEIPSIDVIAELGVTTLLFTIGLKLNPRDISKPRIAASAFGHALANTVVFAGLFALIGLLPLRELTGLSWTALAYIGVATSFSSTIFVMSQLAENNRNGSAIGRIAIGVLVLQDIISVGVLVLTSGKVPEPWALALPLVLLLRPQISRLPDRIFRTELLVLTGVGIAVASYSVFELGGLSGSLGSMIAGILLSGHPLAERMFKALLSVRELLLVAFFIQIGLGGLPGPGGFIIAGILTLLLIPKAWLFIIILQRCGMSARTSAISGLTLANYSEFGLLITSVAVANGVLGAEWNSIMAIAVAASFISGSLVTRKEEAILKIVRMLIPPRPDSALAPDEKTVHIADADAIILGMGRVGEGAYRRLAQQHGMKVYGIEFDEDRIEYLNKHGFEIIPGDASDPELWHRIDLQKQPKLIVLALPSPRKTLQIVKRIRENRGDEVVVATTALYESAQEGFLQNGADVAVNIYAGAGEEIADQAMRSLTGRPHGRR